MSFWDTLRGWAGFPPGAQDGDNLRNGLVSSERYDDSRAAVDGSAAGLAATWACVNLLAGTIASLPLMVYRLDANGFRRPASDHPLYWLLHDSPNYDQTAVDFWEFMCAGLELHGNAYAEIERRGDGFITSLTPIRPDLVQVRRRADGELEYRWTIDGQINVAAQGQILHIRGFGGTPLGGASTLSACRGSFGSAVAVERTARSMFSNGARPTGLLVKDGTPFTREQRLDAERLLQEKFVGAMNAGKPMLLDNGLTWHQLTINPEDAQMLESRRFSVEEIARIFGVPPHMIGHTDKATSWGTGLEQQTLGFQKFTLRRRLKRIEQALEKQLLGRAERRDGFRIEFNLEGLLRGDSKGRSDFYRTMTSIGAMTINEVRELENLSPVPGGDEPRMQMQNIPITGEPGASSDTTPPALPAA